MTEEISYPPDHELMTIESMQDAPRSQARAMRLLAIERYQEICRLRVALKFYADAEHYTLEPDEEFDTISGEAQNWLFSGLENSTTSIETGQIAASALERAA